MSAEQVTVYAVAVVWDNSEHRYAVQLNSANATKTAKQIRLDRDANKEVFRYRTVIQPHEVQYTPAGAIAAAETASLAAIEHLKRKLVEEQERLAAIRALEVTA